MHNTACIVFFVPLGGCRCPLPSTPSFCGGAQARNITASDFPVNITYSVPNHDQFTVTASVKNLVGMTQTNDAIIFIIYTLPVNY